MTASNDVHYSSYKMLKPNKSRKVFNASTKSWPGYENCAYLAFLHNKKVSFEWNKKKHFIGFYPKSFVDSEKYSK